MEFFSRDAGQARRARLNALAEEAVQYVPPELRAWLGIANELNPVVSMERAGQSANALLAPETSGWGRVEATGDMLSNMAGVVAPAVAASRGAVPAAQAVEDALMGFSTSAPGLAAQDFMADEFGGVGFRAFHGSPHDFDRFSLDKIGTGEGAQAYGHGLYFADSEDVARSYRDGLGRWRVDGTDLTIPDTSRVMMTGGDIDAAIASLEGDLASLAPNSRLRGRYTQDLEYLQALKAQNATIAKDGRMYEVNINADPADFLDWDAPLSAQPQKVRDALVERLPPGTLQPGDEDMAAKMLYLGEGPQQATERLRGQGIPGIKYLDAGSRGAGDGSRNYVVFDENLIEIIRKYGWAAAAPIFAQYGMTPEEAQAQYEGQM
jgi:hypothetical protein